MAGRPCKVCSLPRETRETVDAALVGGVELASLSRALTIHRASLRRHRDEHVSELIRQAAAEADAEHGRELLAQMSELHDTTMTVMRRARDGDTVRRARFGKPVEVFVPPNDDLALRAVREARANIELMAKVEGDLDPGDVEVVIRYENDWRAGST